MFSLRYPTRTRLVLLLLAPAALPACSAGREAAKPQATPRLPMEVQRKAWPTMSGVSSRKHVSRRT